MAGLNLVHVWINHMITGASIHYRSSNRSESSGIEGSVKILANGRRRSFSKVGEKRTLAFTLRAVEPDDLVTLRSWEGDLVLVRDYKGRKFYGVFYELAVSELKTIDLYDVTITVTEVSYVEGEA